MRAKMAPRGSTSGLDPYADLVEMQNTKKVLAKRHLPPRQSGDTFRVNNYRIREEDFGAIAKGSGGSVFLDHDGAEFLRQFVPGTRWKIDDTAIKWGKIQPCLLSEFAEKHLIRFESQSSSPDK